MAASGYEHDLSHINVNDALAAIQIKIGTNGSPVPTSLDYLVTQQGANISTLQSSVASLSAQLTIANTSIATNSTAAAANLASVISLTATKLNLSGGRMTGQLSAVYAPPAVSSVLYASSQILISNTGVSDNPPSLGFQAAGILGMALYLNANGLNSITNSGGTAIIINAAGQIVLPAASITSAQLGPTVMPAIQAAVGVPVGSVNAFAGDASVTPPGWLFCNGAAINRTTYAALYAVIGTTYGTGNGSTTFNLPSLSSRMIVGQGQTAPFTNRALAATGGEETHTLTVAEMPSHLHTVTDPGHAHAVYDPTHNHGHSDPGHVHGVVDPTHAHAVADPTHSHQVNLSAGNMTGGGQASWNRGGANSATVAAATGIGIYAAATGIAIAAHVTGMVNVAAATNISIYAAASGISTVAAGSGSAHNTMPPFLVMPYIIKT